MNTTFDCLIMQCYSEALLLLAARLSALSCLGNVHFRVGNVHFRILHHHNEQSTG